MTKHITLFIVAFALSFTACGVSDDGSPSLTSILNQSASSAIEQIDIPDYDNNNSEHVLITTNNGNWSSAILNDLDNKRFYIEAGDYSAMKMRLTSSGTNTQRRTMTLYDPNDPHSLVHPSKLDISKQANVSLTFDNASYWTVSRLSNIDYTYEGSFIFSNNSSHNVLDELHIKDYSYGILIYPFCNYNTIQLSYLNHMTHAGRLSDNVGIALTTLNEVNAITIGTKILDNDIRDANDGIQLVQRDLLNGGSYPGTIIDNNRIWMDSDVYTNGDYSVNGYQDGPYMVGENAIDLKIGSDDASQKVIITNNVMYGYQYGDGTTGGYQDASRGVAFVAHYGVENVVFENNVIYDSQAALAIAGLGSKTYTASDWSIKNNVFSDISLVNPTDMTTYGTILYNVKNMIFENNVFNNTPTNSQNQGFFFSYADTQGGCTFKNNLALNSDGTSKWYNHDDPSKNDGVSIIDIDTNYFFNSLESMNGVNARIVTDIADLNLTSTTFYVQKFEALKSHTLPLTKRNAY